MLHASPQDVRSLQVVLARDESQLQGLCAEWNALAGDVPFRTWEWTRTWWQHYRDTSSELFTLLVLDDRGNLVGIAPWYVTRSPREGRTLRFLGSGEVCSDYLTILCQTDACELVVERLADWLAMEAADEWHLLELDGAAESDATVVRLCERMAERGHLVDRQADMSCWRTELPGDWNEFVAGLSKSRRERTRALLRKTVDKGRVVMRQVQTESELPRGFDVLIELHQRRRRSLSQPGCFASGRFTRFHREMASQFLAAGKLRLSWWELDGRPLAVSYSFAGGDTVYYYQGGFEPELASESPGWIGAASDLKLAIEQGYRAYDFLRGDESYKTSWQATARPLVRVRIVGRQASARVRFATSRGTEKVKGWARRLLSRTKG